MSLASYLRCNVNGIIPGRAPGHALSLGGALQQPAARLICILKCLHVHVTMLMMEDRLCTPTSVGHVPGLQNAMTHCQ